MKPGPAIIFTDLDGTLLDHDDYSFTAAMPALAAIRARRLPLILATSKTLPEAAAINRALGNTYPLIVENGCAMCFPTGHDYPFAIDAHEYSEGHAVIRFSAPYAQIRQFVAQQRAAHDWKLRGFGDMDSEQVAESTGLAPDEAEHARRRLCSEPFVWLDTEENLAAFRAAAHDAGLHITQGGRFFHLMGQSSKAHALQAMRTLFAAGRRTPSTVIALGDSENDREMLHSADIAVVVRRHDGTHLACHGIRQTLFTEQAGPAGWNAAVLRILDDLGLDGADD